MYQFFAGILSGVAAAILVHLGIHGRRRFRAWRSFRPYYRIWSPFASGPTKVLLTGKQYGHTIKISSNERDAADSLRGLLSRGSHLAIEVASGQNVQLQNTNVIAFGSERYNDVTRALMRSVSTALDYEYTADNDLVVNGRPYRSEYRGDVLVRDYGLVCKAPNPFSASHKFLVFSGNHGVGTQGAFMAITSPRQIESVVRVVGGANFYAVVCSEIDQRFASGPSQVSVVHCGLIGVSTGAVATTERLSREQKLLAFMRELGANDATIVHARSRAGLAEALTRAMEIRGQEVDSDAVYFGAMLHDIGRTMSNGIDHGIAGARILSGQGKRLREEFALMPDTIAKIVEGVECHVIGGIRRSWIDKADLPIPAEDYVPQSLEAKIIAFVDQVLHAWDTQDTVFREAPNLDCEVYKQFYTLAKEINLAAFAADKQFQR